VLDTAGEDRFVDSRVPQDPDRARQLSKSYPMVFSREDAFERGIGLALDEERGDGDSQIRRLFENQKRKPAFTGDEANPLRQTFSRFRLSRV
jgi:hypothetical protein